MPARIARILLVFAAAVALIGCPRTPPDDGGFVEIDPPTTSNAEARARFDEAVALYEAGDHRGAAEAFQLFGAEFPTDPLAVRAELYLGRSLAAAGETMRALQIFDAMHAAPDDPATASLAGLYLAFVHGLRGELEASSEVLAGALDDDPFVRVPVGLCIPGDEALLGSLLAEARVQADRSADALADLEQVAHFAPDDALLYYAWDRAVVLAETRMTFDELDARFADGSPFERAVVGAPLVEALVALGDVETAAARLADAEDPMLAMGMGDRYALAATRLATATGETGPRYGAVLTLSGPNRRAGRAALGGILLAQRAFDDESPRSVLLVRDTFESPANAAAAVDELVAAGCAAIIGPIEADLDAAAREAAVGLGVPYVSLTPTPWTDPEPGTWRWQIDPIADAHTAAEVAVADRGVQRVALVVDANAAPDAYLTAWSSAFADRLDALGASVALEVTVDTSDEEIQASAESAGRAIASTPADAVAIALPDAQAGTMLAWMAAANVWPSPDGDRDGPEGRRQVVVIGHHFFVGDALLRNSARYAEGALVPVWFDGDVADDRAAEFATRFEWVYGRSPGALEAFAWDAARWIRHVVVDGGAVGAATARDRMIADPGFDSVVGPMQWDPAGNPIAAPRLRTVRDGAVAPWSP